jgi:hypothetical protein
MTFDFSRAKVKSAKVGKPVHVVKALLDIADANAGVKNVVSIVEHAAEYIKALERAVLENEAAKITIVNNVSNCDHKHAHYIIDTTQTCGVR